VILSIRTAGCKRNGFPQGHEPTVPASAVSRTSISLLRRRTELDDRHDSRECKPKSVKAPIRQGRLRGQRPLIAAHPVWPEAADRPLEVDGLKMRLQVP
jgi:hypothetical protein